MKHINKENTTPKGYKNIVHHITKAEKNKVETTNDFAFNAMILYYEIDGIVNDNPILQLL